MREEISNDVLLVERRANTAIITLNRLQSHNAYNGDIVQRFDEVCDDIEYDDNIQFVIITGAGERSFCAGADLQEAKAGTGDTLLSRAGGYQPLQYRNSSKIWIAAVNGFALGGGFELALHCDFIIAAKTASFGLPEVQHGLLPLGGGLEKLAASLPMPLVKDIVLTGRRLSAEEALNFGIINRISDDANVLDSALSFAEQLAEQSTPALFAANQLLNAIHTVDTEQWQNLCKQTLSDVARKREEGE